MAVKPIPEGYRSLTPYLIVREAARAIEFYQRALGAVERCRMAEPGGRIGHAELRIGDSVVMLADEYPEVGAVSPETLGGPGVTFLVYVENVDEAFARALSAGGRQLRPVKDQFYGDRTGSFEDPFGHHWTLATHVADVPSEEMQRRFQALSKQQG
jgi:PhnB protein